MRDGDHGVLLAGLIDLGDRTAPPHPPGPCAALCTPACCATEGALPARAAVAAAPVLLATAPAG